MRRFFLALVLILVSGNIYADFPENIEHELEGIWVLPGVTIDNFIEINQHVFIEKESENHIYVYWENAYFGDQDYIASLESVSEKNIFAGITAEGMRMIMSFPQHIDYDEIIALRFDSVDEVYQFIPFPYER